jgi:hypothetical protein
LLEALRLVEAAVILAALEISSGVTFNARTANRRCRTATLCASSASDPRFFAVLDPHLAPATENRFAPGFQHQFVVAAVMNNAANRLAEAYTTATGTSTAKITDLGFSYTSRREISDVHEYTSNSGGYYHLTATYAFPAGGSNAGPIGLMATLNPNITGLPTWSYIPDGEGRTNLINAVNPVSQNPLAGTAYNVFSEPQTVTFGSADSDSLSFDPNTGRMIEYQYDVNGVPLTGTPAWNPNGTLGSLNMSDPFYSPNAQTCAYSYDDLARLNGVDCGTGNWGQNFGYDAFGNITKSVPSGHTGQPFNPGYVQTNGQTNNRYASLPSSTPGYDNNGNLTADGFHTYNWDVENRMQQLDSGPS